MTVDIIGLGGSKQFQFIELTKDQSARLASAGKAFCAYPMVQYFVSQDNDKQAQETEPEINASARNYCHFLA